MIGDPRITVMCDQCGHEDDFDMTSLVQRSWDNRNLAAKMKRAGWITRGDQHFCSEECDEANFKGEPASV